MPTLDLDQIVTDMGKAALPLLKDGANALVVRAEDPPTDRFIPRGKQYWKEKSESIFYTRTTGIWQTVWLEAVGDSLANIEKLYLERLLPSHDGNAGITAFLNKQKPVWRDA